jgi:hypothetical protein
MHPLPHRTQSSSSIRTVLKRSGTEVAVAETLNELAVDLERLSIRQFRAKSDIGD